MCIRDRVYAVDASSGWPIWRFRTKGPVIATPTLFQDTLFVGSADGHLYAIDVASGRQMWAYQTNGQVASTPAI